MSARFRSTPPSERSSRTAGTPANVRARMSGGRKTTIDFHSDERAESTLAPVCMERMSRGKVRLGTFVFEEDGSTFQNVPTKGYTDYGGFDISPQLPRGYVYRIGSPEGDDEQPYQELPPGRKIAVGPE